VFSHSDFGKSFKLVITEKPDKEIKDKFFNDLSSIDKQLIEYYKSINASEEKYFNLYSEDNLIGYSRLIFQLEYAVLSEIYVLNDYRELGLGTFMLNSIRSYLDELNIKLRTITLPSDRTAKNFYEANGITARILLMEEKRDKTRYRS
jgi:GNAT superfamily N-acetyltransferase